jgi:hypothetical protein
MPLLAADPMIVEPAQRDALEAPVRHATMARPFRWTYAGEREKRGPFKLERDWPLMSLAAKMHEVARF